MNDFDEFFDFVVVGSGGGSMCAALVMRSAHKRVLILEKTDLIGGSTARSGGVMWIPNNPFMKDDGVDDSLEKAIAYLDGLIGDASDAPGATRARRRTYLIEAPRMIEFLVSQGIRLKRVKEWPDYYDEREGGIAAGRTVIAELFDANALGAWREKLRPSFIQLPANLDDVLELPYLKRSWSVKRLALKIGMRAIAAKLTGKHWVSSGAALQGRMLQAALKAGVELRTDSPVTELIVAGGRVQGVQTTRDGRPWRVGARLGVLVNAGGFARNQRMRDQYIPGTSTKWSLAAPGDTGEMIEEMQRHGAAVAQMEERVGTQVTLPPGSEDSEHKHTAQGMTASPHVILVDQSGVRYMNEGGSYMAYCKGMLARNDLVPAVPSWAVFDSQYVNKYMLAGTLPGSRKPDEWYESGYLRRANSIEALARELKMEATRLQQTIERFNRFVTQDRDEEFHRGERAYDRWLGDPYHKPNPTLGVIDRPPFYAVPVLPGDVSTYGGVVTDEYARVLREDGTWLEGLYATGVSTASVMGRIYPGAGGSIGPAFVWGYVAAKRAAAATDDC